MNTDVRDMTHTISSLRWVFAVLAHAVVGLTVANVFLVADQARSS